MTCTHEKKWLLESSADELKQTMLLDEGWEPFSATPETEWDYPRYHFRKPRPCEKCKEINAAFEESRKIWAAKQKKNGTIL